MGEKIRQVTERATLFRITSNAMINVGHPITCLLVNVQYVVVVVVGSLAEM